MARANNADINVGSPCGFDTIQGNGIIDQNSLKITTPNTIIRCAKQGLQEDRVTVIGNQDVMVAFRYTQAGDQPRAYFQTQDATHIVYAQVDTLNHTLQIYATNSNLAALCYGSKTLMTSPNTDYVLHLCVGYANPASGPDYPSNPLTPGQAQFVVTELTSGVTVTATLLNTNISSIPILANLRPGLGCGNVFGIIRFTNWVLSASYYAVFSDNTQVRKNKTCPDCDQCEAFEITGALASATSDLDTYYETISGSWFAGSLSFGQGNYISTESPNAILLLRQKFSPGNLEGAIAAGISNGSSNTVAPYGIDFRLILGWKDILNYFYTSKISLNVFSVNSGNQPFGSVALYQVKNGVVNLITSGYGIPTPATANSAGDRLSFNIGRNNLNSSYFASQYLARSGGDTGNFGQTPEAQMWTGLIDPADLGDRAGIATGALPSGLSARFGGLSIGTNACGGSLLTTNNFNFPFESDHLFKLPLNTLTFPQIQDPRWFLSTTGTWDANGSPISANATRVVSHQNVKPNAYGRASMSFGSQRDIRVYANYQNSARYLCAEMGVNRVLKIIENGNTIASQDFSSQIPIFSSTYTLFGILSICLSRDTTGAGKAVAAYYPSGSSIGKIISIPYLPSNNTRGGYAYGTGANSSGSTPTYTAGFIAGPSNDGEQYPVMDAPTIPPYCSDCSDT